jgi:hypothetical protein
MNQEIIYQFNPLTRFITRGISESIPQVIISTLWQTLDTFLSNPIRKDYLQVFVLEHKGHDLTLEHFQEEPPYKKIIKLDSSLKELLSFSIKNKIKIYVIDDVDHSTMLLAEEY